MRAPRRRNVYGQAAYALGSGVGLAARNYNTVRKVVAAAKQVLGKRKTGGRSTARPAARKTRATGGVPYSDPAATGNELSTYSRQVGKYPKLNPARLYKLMQAGMTSAIYRAQGITNFDTNVGYYPLANRVNTVVGVNYVLMPIHMWDLTSFPNTNAAITAGHSFAWDSLLSSAAVVRNNLPTQNAGGADMSSGQYVPESQAGMSEVSSSLPNASKACHEWSDIKLNLYGARKRGTTFYIDFIRVKDTLAHPLAADGLNRSKKELFRTLQANLVYSNLQTFNNKNLRQVQFVKRYKFYVPGGSTSDLDLIGKVKQVKLFLKQGAVYNMAWESTEAQDALPHGQEDGIDFTQASGPVSSPWHGSRLLMCIRAFSPERRDITGVPGSNNAPADPLTEPSYDLVLRNKWLLPN